MPSIQVPVVSVSLLDVVGALQPALHIHVTHLLTAHDRRLLQGCLKHVEDHHSEDIPEGDMLDSVHNSGYH